jgi:hypothetical protein
MTTDLEDRLSEALKDIQAPPPPDRLSLVVRRARGRRRRQGIVAVGAVAAMVVAVVVPIAMAGGSDSRQSVRPVHPAVNGEPPILFVGRATARGTLGDNVTRFAPPTHPDSDIAAPQALADAWADNHLEKTTGARLVLAQIGGSGDGRARDAWLVIFYGHARRPVTTIPVPGQHLPVRARTVAAEPALAVVDAVTGKWLKTMSGGRPHDPFVPLEAVPPSGS